MSAAEAPLPDEVPTDDLAQPEDDTEPTEASGKRSQRQARQAAEARAAAAEARVEALLRREVAGHAAALLAEPGDVLDAALGGVELAELLDEHGEVDPRLVEQAARSITERRPGLAVQRQPHQGADFDGGVRQPAPRRAGWADLLGGRR